MARTADTLIAVHRTFEDGEMREAGSHIDDAAAGRAQRRDSRGGDPPGAHQVDVDHRVGVFARRQGRLLRETDPRVVDQDVETSKALERLRDGRVDRGLISDIAGDDVVALSRASNSVRAFLIPGRSGLPAPTHCGSAISVIMVFPLPSEITRW